MTVPRPATSPIIGSGMGGGTMAWALRNQRSERAAGRAWRPVAGARSRTGLPRAVFVDRRYKNAEQWVDEQTGGVVPPGRALLRRRQHEGVRRLPAAVPRGRLQGDSSTPTASRDAWPVTYAEMERYYGAGRGAVRGARHARAGIPRSRTARRPTRIPPWNTNRTSPGSPTTSAGRACTRSAMPMGVDFRDGGRCILCAHLRRLPLPGRRQERRGRARSAPGAEKAGVELADPHPGPHARDDPGRTDRRRRVRRT